MNFYFRKVERSDLEMLLNWRQQEHVNQFMLTKFKGDMAQQLNWYNNVVSKADRNYWVIMLDRHPIGVLNLIDTTYPSHDVADAGFYIGEIKHSNLAGFILPCFYNYIFDDCRFKTIQGHVVKGNSILSMHLFHGYVVRGEKSILTSNGDSIECDEVELTKENWLKKTKLRKKKAIFE